MHVQQDTGGVMCNPLIIGGGNQDVECLKTPLCSLRPPVRD